MINLTELRQDYENKILHKTDLHSNPMAQFSSWFSDAQAADEPEPNAMTLATSNKAGHPNARIVLLKHYDEHPDTGGFVFFTNYKSIKAQELTEQSNACLVFWWRNPLPRQIRIQGIATPVGDEESDAYFLKRDRNANIGAYAASPQSSHIENRTLLEQRFEATRAQFKNDTIIPRPPFWGGYQLVPEAMEFWQGQQSRLHDRFLYERVESQWIISRLTP